MSLARRMIEEAEKVSFRRNTEPLNQGPELACDALCQKLSRRLSNRRTSAEVKGREGQEPVAQRYVRTLRQSGRWRFTDQNYERHFEKG